MVDVAEVVNTSSLANRTQLVADEAGNVLVPTFNCTTFLSPTFKEVKGIKVMQHFMVLADKPGVVLAASSPRRWGRGRPYGGGAGEGHTEVGQGKAIRGWGRGRPYGGGAGEGHTEVGQGKAIMGGAGEGHTGVGQGKAIRGWGRGRPYGGGAGKAIRSLHWLTQQEQTFLITGADIV